MRMITATALLLLSVQIPAQAKTTRTFSGSNPAKVEKNARKGWLQLSGKRDEVFTSLQPALGPRLNHSPQ